MSDKPPQKQSPARVREAVPFFAVTDIRTSVKFYTEGLGFPMALDWTVDGELRWCRLEIDDAGLMLQQFKGYGDWNPRGPLGEGVSICFMCEDAVAYFKALRARGIDASRPFVGNGLWVTTVRDPDGYRLDFESPTDAPEESEYDGPEV